MSNISKFMLELVKNNVRLKLSDNNDLVVNAPKGFWNANPHLLHLLKVNKNKIKVKLAHQNEKVQLKKINRADFDALSYTQNRMWFHQQIHEKNPSYNMPICFRLNDKIDLAKFRQSLSLVIKKHESLRMGFQSRLGEPRQFILTVKDIPDVLITKSYYGENEKKRIIEQFVRQPFKLDNPPLLRVMLLHHEEKASFLVFCFHHIIADGLSINLFLNDLLFFYNNDLSNSSNNQFDYCDYTDWHNNWLNSYLAESQLEYWRERLQHVNIDMGDLKGDKPRPLALTFNVDTVTFPIAKDLIKKLKQYCCNSQSTLYSALLAAYVRLCCEYNDRDSMVVGTPVLGRTETDFDNTVGLFVNTLPLFVQYKSSDSYKSFCTRLTTQVLSDFNNQDYPFDKIVNALNVTRDISKNPFFQTMFLLEYKSNDSFSLSNVHMEPYPINLGIGQFDLTFGVSVKAENIEISIEYNNKIYSKEWILSFKNNYLFLLEMVLENPDKLLQDVILVAPLEVTKQIKFGRLEEEYPEILNLNTASLIDRAASHYYSKLALIGSHSKYTYSDLLTLSDNVARALILKGVRKGDIVALEMVRSEKLITVMLGVWKANATYLPIDPKSPRKRTEYVLHNSACKWVILDITSKIQVSLENIKDKINFLSYQDLVIERNFEISLDYNDPVSPAYIIYTSGTTGLPKGVVVSHIGLNNLISNYQKIYEVTSKDRCSQFATQAFDAFACEVWPMLALGASIYIIDEETKISPSDLVEFFKKNKITVADIPTAIAPMIWDESDSLEVMRLMKIGGEKINKYPPINLPYLVVNTYGPTENTVESTYSFINSSNFTKEPYLSPPIGRPYAGIKAAVLNHQNKFLPIGAVGELILFGNGLANGYLNNHQLTTQKFVEYSLGSGLPALRGYKTGDIVRWLHDGQLEFIGRVDKQVKVRNFRIEISEIECAINQIFEVKNSVVFVHGKEVEDKIIVAFLVLENNSAAQPISEIKARLKEFLPDYMIPAKIMVIDKIPLTTNGKINYESLMFELENERFKDREDYIEPNSEVAIALAEIWSEVLKIKHIGMHDNFFDIGGDSLSSIRISALAKRKNIHLKPLHLHQYKTISEVIRQIKGIYGQKTNDNKEIVTKGNIISSLSPIQNWLIHQGFSEPTHYNQSLLFIVPDFFNIEIANKLLLWLMGQHLVLTMKLSLDNKKFFLDNDVDKSSYIDEVIIRNTTGIGAEIKRVCEEYQTKLDLYKGPLFKLLYIHDEFDEVKRLCIIAHHLLIDVASWFILSDDINYFLLNNRDPLTCIDSLERTTEYTTWIENLEKIQLSQFNPFDFELKNSLSFEKNELSLMNSRMITLSISDLANTRLKKVLDIGKINLQETILLLNAQLIGKILNKSVVLVENESHGRFESLIDGVDLSRSIGWFTVIYPVRIDISYLENSLKSILLFREISERDKVNFLFSESYKEVNLFDFSFNFHGDMRNANTSSRNILLPAPEKITNTISAKNHRSAIFDVNAFIGNAGLQIELTFPERLKDTVGELDQLNLKVENSISTLLDVLNQKILVGESNAI